MEIAVSCFIPRASFQRLQFWDYPIRGKNVFLHIIWRRWFSEATGKVVIKNWDLIAKGTRITSEFATFLKDQ